MEIHVTIRIERKHAFILAGLLVLITILNISDNSLAAVTTGAYHTLDEIYAKIGTQYIPLATTTGKINASLIEGKVANASQADYALNADKLDGKDASAFASATHTHNLNDLLGTLQPSKGGTGLTSCSDGQVLKWSGDKWICGVDNAGSGGISSCSDCSSVFVNRSGDSLTGDLNMQDHNLLDANMVEANIIRDPEDSWVIISDSLRANDIKIINKKNCNKLYTDSYDNVKCGTDRDTRCDTPGRCSQLCIGSDCRSRWPSGGGISSCSDCDSRFVNTAGDSMTGDLNMRDNDILDANIIEANTLRDPEDSTLYVADDLQVSGYVKGSQLCIGGDCRSSWPSGGASSCSLQCRSASDYCTGSKECRKVLCKNDETRVSCGGDCYFNDGWLKGIVPKVD